MENLQEYYIKSFHTVSEYGYNEGELNFYNDYTIKEIIKAENVVSAIEKYINKILGYEFDIQEIEQDEELGFYYDILVNKKNLQASCNEVENWKKGKLKLYNDYINFKVYELKQINQF